MASLPQRRAHCFPLLEPQQCPPSLHPCWADEGTEGRREKGREGGREGEGRRGKEGVCDGGEDEGGREKEVQTLSSHTTNFELNVISGQLNHVKGKQVPFKWTDLYQGGLLTGRGITALLWHQIQVHYNQQHSVEAALQQTSRSLFLFKPDLLPAMNNCKCTDHIRLKCTERQ